MDIEQMRIRMGEMAAEIERLSSENDRLRREFNATDMSWENALAGHKHYLRQL